MTTITRANIKAENAARIEDNKRPLTAVEIARLFTRTPANLDVPQRYIDRAARLLH